MSPKEPTYEDGVLEGKFLAIEAMQSTHGLRLEIVEKRLTVLERVAYILLGAVALVQFAPSLKTLIQ